MRGDQESCQVMRAAKLHSLDFIVQSNQPLSVRLLAECTVYWRSFHLSLQICTIWTYLLGMGKGKWYQKRAVPPLPPQPAPIPQIIPVPEPMPEAARILLSQNLAETPQMAMAIVCGVVDSTPSPVQDRAPTVKQEQAADPYIGQDPPTDSNEWFRWYEAHVKASVWSP